MNKYIRVPYAKSVHGTEEIDEVKKVLNGNTALGDRTKLFEKKIAVMFGKKYGVMVNSGSSANLLAMELIDGKKGAEVITPMLTFATTVAPIIQKGFIPVFVDVEEGTYVLDINQVEKAVTKRTKAIMAPSLIGNVPELDKLRRIAKKHNLILIEDSCDTLGAKYKKRSTGEYSDISTTSFYGSHIINGAGGGGMILVSSRDWMKRLVVLRGWGRSSSLDGESVESENIGKRFGKKIGKIDYDSKFIFSEIGYNFLPLEVSSAFALVQLKKFRKFVEARKKNFKRLLRFFNEYNSFFILPKQTRHSDAPWLAFPLTIKKEAPFTRKQFTTFLEKRNIQTRPIFTGNIAKQPAFSSIGKKTPFNPYTATNNVMTHGLLLGCYQGMTNKQLNHIESMCREFLKRY